VLLVGPRERVRLSSRASPLEEAGAAGGRLGKPRFLQQNQRQALRLARMSMTIISSCAFITSLLVAPYLTVRYVASLRTRSLEKSHALKYLEYLGPVDSRPS